MNPSQQEEEGFLGGLERIFGGG